MSCESYKQSITDAAAANEVPSREVAAHLNACHACRTFFAEERQLFAAIDSGISASVNREVPASLLPRVRARLDEQILRGFPWTRVGALLASAALVLMGALVLEKMRSTSRETVAPVNTVTVSPAPKESPVVIGPDVEELTTEPPSTKWTRRRVVRRPERTAEGAVLVPAGQREAVDKLLAALDRGTVTAEDLPSQKTARLSTNGALALLGIPEIEIKPLAAVSEPPGADTKVEPIF